MMSLLRTSVHKMKSAVFYKKKYTDICFMFLSSIHQEFSVSEEIVYPLYTLMMEGEIKLVNDFMRSMSDEWTSSTLKSCTAFHLSEFCMILLKCGVLESTISSSFSTNDEKEYFFYGKDYIIRKLFTDKHQIDDIDRIISAFLSNIEDVQSYKKKFVKGAGFDLCFSLLLSENVTSLMEFVYWNFTSSEEIVSFYHKFFISRNMSTMFSPRWFKRSCKNIASLIKANNSLGRQFNGEFIFNAFLPLLRKHCSFLLGSDRTLFESLDSIFLACFQDSQEKLNDFKTDMLSDKKRIISFLQKCLDSQIKKYNGSKNWVKRAEEAWLKIVEDFFTWMCSSDQELKDEFKEQFMRSKPALKALRSLRSGGKRTLPF